MVLNFTIDSILQFIGTIIGWAARLSNVLLPILIGLILATIILSVVFYWDKISTTVKLLFLAAVVLGALFIINGENIIAYIATNSVSLGINLMVIFGFAIINYILYKYTNNGLLSNVFQILSVLFLARWIYLYAFGFYGSSGVKTFTSTIGTGTTTKPAPNAFFSYLTDINFYCETIKSLFTGVIKYFLLAIFLFYVWFTIYIYYKNSFEFLTTYKTLSLLGFLTIGVLLLVVLIYSMSGSAGLKEVGPYTELLSKISLSFITFAVVIGLIIYGFSKVMSVPSTLDQIISIINFLLLFL